jgi:hypothetical protein
MMMMTKKNHMDNNIIENSNNENHMDNNIIENPNNENHMDNNIIKNIDPVLLVIVRALSILIAGASTIMIMNQVSALDTPVLQPTHKNFRFSFVLTFTAKIGLKFIGNAIGGTVELIINSLSDVLFRQNGSNIEPGLLIKLLAKPGEQIIIVTGPNFGMFVIKHGTYLIIGIVLFVSLKFAIDKVIDHTCAFLYYKDDFDKSKNDFDKSNENEIEPIIIKQNLIDRTG